MSCRVDIGVWRWGDGRGGQRCSSADDQKDEISQGPGASFIPRGHIVRSYSTTGRQVATEQGSTLNLLRSILLLALDANKRTPGT